MKLDCIVLHGHAHATYANSDCFQQHLMCSTFVVGHMLKQSLLCAVILCPGEYTCKCYVCMVLHDASASCFSGALRDNTAGTSSHLSES